MLFGPAFNIYEIHPRSASNAAENAGSAILSLAWSLGLEGVNFIAAKSWTQCHFVLYAKHLRIFLRHKSTGSSPV